MTNTEKRLAPVHPGDILKATLEGFDISSYALAKAIGKTPTQVHRIANAQASITAGMARLIGKALGTSAEMWMNLQAQYDLEMAAVEAPHPPVSTLIENGKKVA